MITTERKSKVITPVVLANYLNALKLVHTNTLASEGSVIVSKTLSIKYSVTEHFLPVCVKLNIIAMVTGTQMNRAYHWLAGEPSEEMAIKVINMARQWMADAKRKSEGRKKPVKELVDLNKEITQKLAQRSVDKATASAKANSTIITTSKHKESTELDPNARTIMFDTPRIVVVNGIVTVQNVDSIILTVEDSKVVIFIHVGNSAVMIRIPNRGLQLNDRYSPGKDVPYTITSI